jgi:hypothetical protein
LPLAQHNASGMESVVLGRSDEQATAGNISVQRAINIPPGHPVTINLSERFLLQATLGCLARAVYGPDRLDYW